MAKIKMFPRVDLTIPGIEHTRGPAGEVVIPLEDIPPPYVIVKFSEQGNGSNIRSFDFGPRYGHGINEITYACQRQIERFLATHDGDLSVATVVNYCYGIDLFLNYLMILHIAVERELKLGDINRDVIDGFLDFLDDDVLSTSSQKTHYQHTKSVLVALGQRGLILIISMGDEATFPDNPFPNSRRNIKGERPLPKAQRRAFTAAVKTAVMPLFAEGAEPTSELLAYALLITALHTGRNTTPLIEMYTDCLRAHPKDKVLFLCVFKRRGNKTSQVPLRMERSVESLSSVMPTVAQLVRRVIELSDSLRQEAPSHLKDRVWLYRVRAIKDNGKVTALSRSTLHNATQKLIRYYDLRDTDGKLMRINVSRLRKTFTNRIYEILDNDPVATAVAAGNTPQVLGNHYLRPGESAERNWKFMGAALTYELMTATLGTTEMTPTGRCTDNLQGQYAPRKDGATCMSFLDCLRCRNYVVTGDDLYRLFSFFWRIFQERSRMGKRKWEKHYRHIVRLIDRDVIEVGINKKVFRQTEVDAARERARTDPHPYWKTEGMFEAF